MWKRCQPPDLAGIVPPGTSGVTGTKAVAE
jgi:hypothetical protein